VSPTCTYAYRSVAMNWPSDKSMLSHAEWYGTHSVTHKLSMIWCCCSGHMEAFILTAMPRRVRARVRFVINSTWMWYTPNECRNSFVIVHVVLASISTVAHYERNRHGCREWRVQSQNRTPILKLSNFCFKRLYLDFISIVELSNLDFIC